MQKFLRHLRANVVAYIALFFSLGGTAYAAATIGSAQIVNDSIQSIDVRNDTSRGGGLLGADIRNGALRGGDVATDSLTGADIQETTLDVSRIVARPRGGSMSIPVNTSASPAAYPLASNTWLQAANQTNVGYASVVYDMPAMCEFGGMEDWASAVVQFYVGDQVVATAVLLGGTPKDDAVASEQFVLPERGAASFQTLTAKVSTSCENVSGKIESVGVAVNGIR